MSLAWLHNSPRGLHLFSAGPLAAKRKPRLRFPNRARGGFALMLGLILTMIVGSVILTFIMQMRGIERQRWQAISIGNQAAGIARSWQAYLIYDGPARLGVDASDLSRIQAAYLPNIPADVFGGPAGQAMRPAHWFGASSIEIADGVTARLMGSCPPASTTCLGVVELYTTSDLNPRVKSFLEEWLGAELAARGAQDWLVAQEELWTGLGVGSQPTSLYFPGTAFYRLDERAVLRYDFAGESPPVIADIDMGGNTVASASLMGAQTVQSESARLAQMRADDARSSEAQVMQGQSGRFTTPRLEIMGNLLSNTLTLNGSASQFGSVSVQSGLGLSGELRAPLAVISRELQFSDGVIENLTAPTIRSSNIVSDALTGSGVASRLNIEGNFNTNTLRARTGNFNTITTGGCQGC